MKTKLRSGRLVLPHTSMATDTVLRPYPTPHVEPRPAEKQGWGSLGAAPKAAQTKAPKHEPKKRTIFRPSKKAIPKQHGQLNILGDQYR